MWLAEHSLKTGNRENSEPVSVQISLINWPPSLITVRPSSYFKVDVLQSVVLRAGQNSKAAGVRWLLQQESCSWRIITSLYRYLSDWRTACLSHLWFTRLWWITCLFLQGSDPAGDGRWHHDRHGCEWEFMKPANLFVNSCLFPHFSS